MNNYTILKPEDISSVFSMIDKLESDDPNFILSDKNYVELSKGFIINLKHFISVLALIDYLSVRLATIDIKDIEKVKVKRAFDKWSFKIIRTRGQQPLDFLHTFKNLSQK